jgi:hypothetical protein
LCLFCSAILTPALLFLQSDQNFAIETAAGAVRAQEKEGGEQAVYNKGLAQAVKKELDAQKGWVRLTAAAAGRGGMRLVVSYFI